MRIALLIAGLPPERIGGAELQAAQVAAYLSERHEVSVLTRSSTVPPELVGRQSATVIRRSRTDVPVLRFAADLMGTLAILGARRRELDLIISYQTVIDGLIAALARRLFGIPVLHSVRSTKEYQLKDNLKSRLFSPFVFRNVDRLALQSQSVEEDLANELATANRGALMDSLRAKLRILPNGVELSSSGPGDGKYVLYVGRLVKPKGVVHLLDAMKRCTGQSLVIAGDGPEMARLRSIAKEMENVEFVGRVDPSRVSGYIRDAKVVVLPSLRDEGLPNVVMQAMAHGKPVIASRGAGTSDLVRHGETGFLTEPGDSASIARNITKLCEDEELRRQMGERGRLAIEAYSWPDVIGLIEKELAELATLERRE